jgi:peptidoglycan/LPS O-acetylase OafA/YrhL
VTIFLFVSGLSLECASGGRPVRFGSFLLRRIVRIYPTYYLSLVAALGVSAAFALWGAFRGGKAFGLGVQVRPSDALLMLTGFQAFAGRWGGPLVWSSWFIGLIMSLYVVFPLISRLLRRHPWAGAALLLAVSAASRLWTAGGVLRGDPLAWFPPNRLFEFGLGVLFAAQVGRERLARPNRALSRLPGLQRLAELSFPLFLLHDPLRRLIRVGDSLPLSLAVGVPLFLAASVALSVAALGLQRRIEQRLGRFPALRPA